MQLYKYLALLSMIFIGGQVMSQTQQPVKLKGYVYDMLTNKPMRGVSVINPKSGYTYGTDATGHFEMEINKNDTLFLFCPTYKTIKFSVSDSALRYIYELNLAIEPLTQTTANTVVIMAPKSLEEIEEQRKKLGQTPKELERGEISPFTSPISAIYEMLSERTQQKEKLKEQIKEDDRRKIFKELLRYYNENDLIDLPEEDFEDFINYCNLPLEFLKYESDYAITKTIMDAYNKYALNNGLIK